MTNALLSIQDLVISYHTRQEVVHAVSGVTLNVFPGEITAIVGESGSGKSTTAMAAIGLLAENASVEAGSITFDGQNLTHSDEKQWRSLRGIRIALIPQDPNNSLNPQKTIGAILEEGMIIHSRYDAAERKRRALAWLDKVGITESERRYNQYPHELSGGMKQRVLIAAALALEPELIIADEPTSALDVTVQKRILDLLDELRKETGVGILFITHDLAVAGDRADQVVVMEKGQMRESGDALPLLTKPQHEYTRRLLADAPSLFVGQHGSEKHRSSPQAGADVLVRVQDLSKNFGDFEAISDISFDVARGTTHALVGESGSGKTTIGRAIALFNTLSTGSIHLGDRDITALGEKERRELRSRIQMVYQNPFSSLNPRMAIGDIIAEPARNILGLSKSAARQRAQEFMELVALNPASSMRKPAELSGGQRQRVAIARAIIVEPELVILDEAVSALDVTVQAQILRLLDRLQKDMNLTYIFISHDLAVVGQISDTISVLYRGKQVECGATSEVFAHPQSRYTRELIEAIPGSRYRLNIAHVDL